MSLNSDIRDRAYQFFIEEAQELLQTLETGLLNLDEDLSTERVHELMRAAHSLKGGAASMDLEAIKTLAHRLEDFFKALYSDKVEFDSELESLLLEAYDCLRSPLTEQIETGAFDSQSALVNAEPIFTQLEELLEDALQETNNYISASADSEVDIIASVFEEDVAQSIERLANILADSNNQEIIREVKAQAEVFAEFAELFNLPGFGEIAQAATTAIDNYPEKAVEIGNLMLADCRVARDLVLDGDRLYGGEPSEALLALSQKKESQDIVSEDNLEISPEQEQISVTDSLDRSFDDGLETSVPHNPSEPEESLEIPQPRNLDEAIASVEQIFDKLPPLQSSFLPPSPSKPKEKVTTTPENKVKSDRHKDTKITNLTVRIDLNRLEKMNNIIGELVINRNSLSLQNKQLQQNVKELNRKFARFHKITVQLREFADRLSIESERPQNNYFSVINIAKIEFDSLEMDRYSRLHILLQKVLEEMMQLEEGMEDISLFARQSDRTIQQQRQMLGQMRDELMWARMLPLNQILQRFPRLLRNLSNQYKKPVTLKMIGTEVLVDKAVLEKLYDPLVHLLRNAFDHGIEPPAIRRQQGKSAKGNITIHAYYQGNRTIIEVRDDGRGLNLTKIASQAIKQGLLSTEQAQIANKEELLDLIFEAGFSTADRVSELSGRGVGMNIVRSQLQLLKGTITVDSSPKKGTTFTLSLPLTLTIAKLLVCSSGLTAFAVPSNSIEEIIIPKSDQIKLSGGRRFLSWNQQLVPIYAAKDLLRYNCAIYSAGLRNKTFDTVDFPLDWALPLLLLRLGQQLFALEIDKLITEQELVIKPFGNEIAPPSYIYGCTILGDGTLLPVINGVVLIDKFWELSTIQAHDIHPNTQLELSANIELETKDKKTETVSTKTVDRPTILVVDDSTNLRKTMALSLEKQGYRVLQAGDGRQALDRLKDCPDIDLIICDIEMPNMNGFEFLSVRRRDSLLVQIPVIILTSRSGEKHRSLAKQLGASAYFTKPYVEQNFIGEIKTILEQKNNSYEEEPKSTSKIISNSNILIIDDSPALRRTMTLSLEKKGYRVLQARHGKEGLEQLKQNPQVNLIICDIEMPIMNGFEFLDAHRQNAKISHIPVAMLFSRNSEKHHNLAKQLGAIAFFTKPYIEEEFLQEINNFIATHRRT